MSDLVLGTKEYYPDSFPMKCSYCKNNVFFRVKHDFKKQKPVCLDCAVEKNLITPESIAISRETEEDVKKLFGLNDADFDKLVTEFKEYLTRKVGM